MKTGRASAANIVACVWVVASVVGDTVSVSPNVREQPGKEVVYTIRQEGQTGLPQFTHGNIYRFVITNACSGASILVETEAPVASSRGEVRLHHDGEVAVLGTWDKDRFPADSWLRFDASRCIQQAGQYDVEVAYTGGDHGLHTYSVAIRTWSGDGLRVATQAVAGPPATTQSRNSGRAIGGANLPQTGRATNSTLYWSCADVADVYINGAPIMEYRKDFTTRGNECDRIFEVSRPVGKGDKITVGARRGGVCGFTMVVKDPSGKTIVATDSRNWRAYEPRDRVKWYLPENVVKSMKKPSIQGNPWPPQRSIMVRHDVKAQSIWDENKNAVYLTTTVE